MQENRHSKVHKISKIEGCKVHKMRSFDPSKVHKIGKIGGCKVHKMRISGSGEKEGVAESGDVLGDKIGRVELRSALCRVLRVSPRAIL